MKVRELMHELSSMDPEAEVRIASGANWPMEYSVGTVAEVLKPSERLYKFKDALGWWALNDDGDGDIPEAVNGDPFETEETLDAWLAEQDAEHVARVYIAEGGQLGYLPADARRAVSW